MAYANDENVAQVLYLVSNYSLTQREIAEMVNVHQSTVSLALSKLGLKAKPYYRTCRAHGVSACAVCRAVRRDKQVELYYAHRNLLSRMANVRRANPDRFHELAHGVARDLPHLRAALERIWEDTTGVAPDVYDPDPGPLFG